MHNSFDLIELSQGKWRASSHNFPEFVGEGKNEKEALEVMNRKIIHYKQNNLEAYNQRLRDRLKKGLACECGVKLDSPVLAIM